GLGSWLRMLAKQYGLYANRRPFQIVVSAAVALIVVVLLLYGLFWIWHYTKRYRLAIGFTALALGFGIIRFVSLHEVDAWNAAMPWARVVVELIATAGASAVAIARLRQLGEFAGGGAHRSSKQIELNRSAVEPADSATVIPVESEADGL